MAKQVTTGKTAQERTVAKLKEEGALPQSATVSPNRAVAAIGPNSDALLALSKDGKVADLTSLGTALGIEPLKAGEIAVFDPAPGFLNASLPLGIETISVKDSKGTTHNIRIALGDIILNDKGQAEYRHNMRFRAGEVRQPATVPGTDFKVSRMTLHPNPIILSSNDYPVMVYMRVSNYCGTNKFRRKETHVIWNEKDLKVVETNQQRFFDEMGRFSKHWFENKNPSIDRAIATAIEFDWNHPSFGNNPGGKRYALFSKVSTSVSEDNYGLLTNLIEFFFDSNIDIRTNITALMGRKELFYEPSTRCFMLNVQGEAGKYTRQVGPIFPAETKDPTSQLVHQAAADENIATILADAAKSILNPE